jgi:hypothetical protein
MTRVMSARARSNASIRRRPPSGGHPVHLTWGLCRGGRSWRCAAAVGRQPGPARVRARRSHRISATWVLGPHWRSNCERGNNRDAVQEMLHGVVLPIRVRRYSSARRLPWQGSTRARYRCKSGFATNNTWVSGDRVESAYSFSHETQRPTRRRPAICFGCLRVPGGDGRIDPTTCCLPPCFARRIAL